VFAIDLIGQSASSLLVAIELNLEIHVYVGHGRSYHFNKDTSYNFLAYLCSIREVFDSIGWQDSAIIGHSMGASVASTFAATYPDRASSLVMIDGFGPFTRPADKTLAVIRHRLEFDFKLANKTSSDRKSYPTLADAIAARMENVKKFPGKQFISYEAARALVSRYNRHRNRS
jgi:pimeloyl-ACP methyl ester carboxylesterase